MVCIKDSPELQRWGVFDFREVFFWQPVSNIEVRILGEKAEIGDCVGPRTTTIMLVELCLRKDMVYL